MILTSMSSIQFNIYRPSAGCAATKPKERIGKTCSFLYPSSHSHASYLYVSPTHKLRQYDVYPRLIYSSPNYKRCAPAYAFGGKGNSASDNEPFSWESLKKAMGGLKGERSVQDLLREQMQDRDFGGDGGNGDSPGSGGDGSGDSEDEGLAGIFDELLQVILATIGFIFVYIYMIRGEELTRLARDYIKYLFGARSSMRLKRAMYKWKKFYESITKKEVVRENWLERAIVVTPTWWHKPRRLANYYYENYKNQEL
ncbi:uncharacterized protein [Typha angustifolia]|uniref:uncharacterized protein n=1 Tax=Typha angustifolia TaxID=59011 RepID=UPI003C2FB679